MTNAHGDAASPEHFASRRSFASVLAASKTLDATSLQGESFTAKSFEELMQEPRFCGIPVSMLPHLRPSGKTNFALHYWLERHDERQQERKREQERKAGQAAIRAAVSQAFPLNT